ncbi:Mrp/NBP35 family ATP-binding protein [Paenibacillus turpanensis]|uniref:Mrp/NBP35 family ATP-binding protein n=1 Tax=Paenibacillus turpanensis TaxID=2689078 RepID=UPI00140AAB98|nr:Mrp/NBP35 family ATP-binding protein [Paenibacillus turpanensis]
MLTREQVLEGLQHLQHPHWKQSLLELGLIRDVMVKPEQIALTLVSASEEEQVNEALKQEVETVLRELGADQVHIRTRMISDFERAELTRKTGGSTEAPKQASTPPTGAPQHHGLSPMLENGSGTQFIAVASGKGGVGKSTVTVNLAVALARRGKRVGIMDADIYGFSVPDMMGIEERPQLIGQKIIPAERYGVKVISMGFFVEDNAPIIWRGPMLGKMLRNFFAEVEWGELDVMLLDLPPGTGDVALDVHQMIPQSKEVLVTTPHATASFVAARAGAMALHTNHEILGVVENMSYYQCSSCGNKDFVFGRGGGAKLAQELHTELLAQIPLGAPDNHPAEADYSPSVYKAESETGKLYLEMADRIIQKIEL